MGWFLITEIDIRCSRSVNKVFKGTDTHTTNLNPMKFYDQRRTMNGNPFNYINIIEMFGLC